MKFEKESFINFLKSLKKGSELIVQEISQNGTKQTENFASLESTLNDTKKELSDIKNSIEKKEIDLKPLENSVTEKLENIATELKIIETTLVNTQTEEVTVKNPIEISKPSWFPTFEKISLEPITAFFSEIQTLLKKITERETITLPLINGRVPVEVDRVGGGGGGGKINISNLATIEKQLDTLFHYKLARLPVTGDTLIYLGYLNKDGGWYITEIDETAGTQKYVKGDSDIGTAWSNRTSQIYQDFNQIF